MSVVCHWVYFCFPLNVLMCFQIFAKIEICVVLLQFCLFVDSFVSNTKYHWFSQEKSILYPNRPRSVTVFPSRTRKQAKSGDARREITCWHQAEGSDDEARGFQRLMPASDLPNRTTRRGVFPVCPVTLWAQTTQLSLIHRHFKTTHIACAAQRVALLT